MANTGRNRNVRCGVRNVNKQTFVHEHCERQLALGPTHVLRSDPVFFRQSSHQASPDARRCEIVAARAEDFMDVLDLVG